MKTATIKTVKTLCAVVVFAALSAPAIAQVYAGQSEKVQAHQIYRYTYAPENFTGSIAHDLQLTQQSILADVREQNRLSAHAALEASASELSGYTQVAQVTLDTGSEGAPDKLFRRTGYTFGRSYQVYL